MNQINLKLFGALRKYGVDSKIELEVPTECTVDKLEAFLSDHIRLTHADFAAGEILKVSAFADEERILLRDEVVPLNGVLAVLPPVCGG